LCHFKGDVLGQERRTKAAGLQTLRIRLLLVLLFLLQFLGLSLLLVHKSVVNTIVEVRVVIGFILPVEIPALFGELQDLRLFRLQL